MGLEFREKYTLEPSFGKKRIKLMDLFNREIRRGEMMKTESIKPKNELHDLTKSITFRGMYDKSTL